MRYLLPLLSLLFPSLVFASTAESHILDLTHHWVGYVALSFFGLAYLAVILEEQLHMRKSKPVLLAAGIIWVCVAIAYNQHGDHETVEHMIRDNFLEYVELFFFLLVAMTYINAMIERGVFDALRNWLIEKGFTYRALFWLTGALAFFISPVADNLTTALIMCAVVMAVGRHEAKFVSLSCINIVIGANAGGAFSPFGDITTLMVWQKGLIPFFDFFELFVPAAVNFVVPAIIMHFALPAGTPDVKVSEGPAMKTGGLVIVGLFLATIVTAVSFHNFLYIPPVFGMMLGLAYLKFFGFYLRMKAHVSVDDTVPASENPKVERFDIFKKIAMAEWDTLFFFYGVIMCVGGLSFIGYLSLASEFIYGQLGPTMANILIGVMSAVVDNIPVMFAVLTMNPEMSEWQWMLVTLTAGVGGSLLSIGSAAGVALMGQARGTYTFFGHLKWTPAIALGYAASIYVHYLING